MGFMLFRSAPDPDKMPGSETEFWFHQYIQLLVVLPGEVVDPGPVVLPQLQDAPRVASNQGALYLGWGGGVY